MFIFERYLTLFINWAVKPFSMTLLGWPFIGGLFRPYLPAGQIDSYIADRIILAASSSILCRVSPNLGAMVKRYSAV